MSDKIRVCAYLEDPTQFIDLGSLDYEIVKNLLVTWKPFTLLHIGNLELADQCNALIESIPIEEYSDQLFKTNYPYHSLPIYTLPPINLDTGLTDVLADVKGDYWLLGSNFTLNYAELLTLCQDKGEEVEMPVFLLQHYLNYKLEFGNMMYPKEYIEQLSNEVDEGLEKIINVLLTEEEEMYILSGAATLYRKLKQVTSENDSISVRLIQFNNNLEQEQSND